MAAMMIVVAVFLCGPAPSWSLEPIDSFDHLGTRLKPGETVWITDAQGRDVKGKVQSLGAEAITVDADGPRTFSVSDVRLVQHRERDSLKNGTLSGLGIGVGLLAVLIAVQDFPEGVPVGAFASVLGIFGGVGAGLGALIDAALPGKKAVVYRAGSASPPAHLSLAPILTPRRQGVTVTYRFE
jgi:hypothetical protein